MDSNKLYQYTINPDDYVTLTFDGYTYGGGKVAGSSNNYFSSLFSYLNYGETKTYNIAPIAVKITGSDGSSKTILAPVDYIRNKDALDTIADIYAAKDNTENEEYTTFFDYTAKYANFFQYLDYLHAIGSNSNIADDISRINSYATDLYDFGDTDNVGYSKYIYRAARNNTDLKFIETGDYARLNKNVPVFTVSIASNDYNNIGFNLYVRNIPIPMRKTQISTNSFIFTYPEYLLNAGSVGVWDETAYIAADRSVDDITKFTFGYSYLDSTKNLLIPSTEVKANSTTYYNNLLYIE
jgi:hypothetical protein